MKSIFSKWFKKRNISRKKALRIVAKKSGADVEELKCYDKLPNNFRLYDKNSIDESSWCVSVPWMDGRDGTMLRSSRIILVSKHTGKILFDGSANDEG